MNPELVNQVEQLSAGCMQAKAGDIATLAGLLEQCDTLRQLGQMHGLPGVTAPADALGEYLKRMIMGDGTGDDAISVLRDAIAVLQEGLMRGEVPAPGAYPAALEVAAWEPEPSPEAPADQAGADVSAGGDACAEVEPPTAAAAQVDETPGAKAVPRIFAWPASHDANTESLVHEPEAQASGESAPGGPLPQAGGDEGAFAADEELLGEYLTEQRGRLDEIEGYLLRLERAADETALADLRRALHTIKGDSGFLGLSQVARVSHAAEGYLEAASYPYDLEPLFAVKDWLARAFENLAASGHLAPSTEASLRQLLSRLGVSAEDDHPLQAAASAAEIQAEPEAEALPEAAPADDVFTEAPEPEPTVLSIEADDEQAGELPAQSDAAVEAPAQATAAQLSADPSLLGDFISESREHLEQASAELLALENNPDNEEAINCVFRAFHTVKGIAGFLNLDEIAELAHDTENLLDQVRRGERELSPALTDLVFEALDWMTRLIGNVRKGVEGDGTLISEPELRPFLERINAASQGRLGEPPAGERTQRLGEILVQTGAVERTVMEEAAQEAQRTAPGKRLGETLVERSLVTPGQVHAALRQQAAQGQAPQKGVELKETLRVDYERLENMINTIGELVLAEAMISQDDELLRVHSEMLDKKLYNLRQVSRKLQELGTTIRMVPISGTFQKMARLVRDLSRKSGKSIQFVSHGDETELDRAYVDLVADPLVHMIRNAVDHGIETPGERRQAGKSEAGLIELRAFHEGGNIHVEVRDDGHGLDVERIFAKALEKDLVVAEERERMSEQEIMQLIFLPGFSTATQITEVSGRGVGMDVVRRNISELRGQVQIASEPGAGTLFKIILPLTLALIDGMLVRVGRERFIFPVLSVVESTRPTRDMVNTLVGKGEMISLRGRQLPLYRLNRLFSVPDAQEDVSDALVVVVEYEGRQMGIVVDELVGIQQTVIKNLGHGLFETVGLSGGSIMPDGTVGLIVDIAGLVHIAHSKGVRLSETLN